VRPQTFRLSIFLLAILSSQLLYCIVSALRSCHADHQRPKKEYNRDVHRIRAVNVPSGLDLSKVFFPHTNAIEGGTNTSEKPETIVPLPDGVAPRVFQKWTRPFPCFEPDVDWWKIEVQRTPTRQGFFFMKEMKTGSSTVAGVHLRISHNVALRQGSKYSICKSRFDHALAIQLKYARRSNDESFLWTVLREPTTRATSQFFHFAVSREKVEPSDKNFQAYLEHPMFTDYYIKSLSMESHFTNKTMEVKTSVGNVLKDYDFIGIMERMDETLVVLSLLLDLPLTDVLYLKAKGSGGFDDGRHGKRCVYIVPPYVSPTMAAYLASPKWKNRIRGDDYLYRLANQSLDRTIEALGTDLVARKVEEYIRLRSLADKECSDKVSYPCTSSGERVKTISGCLWQDSGCGTPCLDNVTEIWKGKVDKN
jgi:hypothetical protein